MEFFPRPLWQRYLAVFAYLLAAAMLTQLGGLMLVSLRPGLVADQGKGLPFAFLMQSMVVQMAGFLLPAPLLMKFTRGGAFAFGPVRMREIFLCCALTFASLIFFSALYHYIKVEPQQLGFLNGEDILRHKGAFLVITSLLVPGYEEWVFRGLIFGVLVSGLDGGPRVFMAGAFSALLFTASHIEGKHSLSALPPILVMAGIFQYSTWKTQSLWPAATAHALQNLLSSAAFFTKYAAAGSN